MEFLGMIIANATGTAVGAVLVKVMLADALEKPSRMSKRADDRLAKVRALVWLEEYVKYIMRCMEAGRDIDPVIQSKIDALVESRERGEITDREFSDELRRLDIPGPLSG